MKNTQYKDGEGRYDPIESVLNVNIENIENKNILGPKSLSKNVI